MTKAKSVVIALGGNAIANPQGRGTVAEQLSVLERSAREIAKVIQRGYRVILTHGNGPQVGNLLLQQDAARETVPPLSLDVCDAMTQGQLGYLLQQKLDEALQSAGLRLPIATVITRVQVDPRDRAFQEPTKPIGPFYSDTERALLEERGYVIEKVGRGAKPWRRVVASPEPKQILELASIRLLSEAGTVVIACGGGGVPVIQTDGRFKGIEAVIDKDLASALLAQRLPAEYLLILTNIDQVALHFGTPQQTALSRLSTTEAKRYLYEGHFPPGSMGPKIAAAVRFVESGGERAFIASVARAVKALEGQAGTMIYRE